MNHIGVLNFTRMGDLIQCGPLLERLRHSSPESKLTLIVLENFAETARRLPMVDDVISFPLDRFIPRLDQRRISLADLFVELDDFAGLLRTQRFTHFYNLAHTPLSAALTWLVHAPQTFGMTYDSSGHILVTHSWINYYFYVTLNRTYNPFNLVEMYLPIADANESQPSLSFRVSPEDENEASHLLQHVDKNTAPLIAFQMGAADTRRQWLVESFAALAGQLIKKHDARIVVLGTNDDKILSRKLCSLVDSDSILDLTGKTSLGSLAAVLKHCRVLVSNDTGTIHLAAAVKTRTVGIYLGPACAKDTAPYGDGHLLLEPQIRCAPCAYRSQCVNHVCHYVVHTADVAQAVRLQIKGETNSPLMKYDHSQLKIHRTQVTHDGALRLIPLIKLPLTRNTFFYSFYRVFWPLLLENLQSHVSLPAEKWMEEMDFLNRYYTAPDAAAVLTRHDAEAITAYEEIALRTESVTTVLQKELASAQPSLSRLRKRRLSWRAVICNFFNLKKISPNGLRWRNISVSSREMCRMILLPDLLWRAKKFMEL
ncbi:glycosyltransferase family 9 protein [bacterium]|nr:glycosyltransferase family 9 protein [bacterium]